MQLMLDNGCEMNNFVMDGMLSVYTQAGRINRALAWWDKYKEFGLEPFRNSYGHMILVCAPDLAISNRVDVFSMQENGKSA